MYQRTSSNLGPRRVSFVNRNPRDGAKNGETVTLLDANGGGVLEPGILDGSVCILVQVQMDLREEGGRVHPAESLSDTCRPVARDPEFRSDRESHHIPDARVVQPGAPGQPSEAGAAKMRDRVDPHGRVQRAEDRDRDRSVGEQHRNVVPGHVRGDSTAQGVAVERQQAEGVGERPVPQSQVSAEGGVVEQRA